MQHIPNCRLCSWLRKRICADCDAQFDALWKYTNGWEYWETGYYQLRDEEPDRNRELLDRADGLLEPNPTAAAAAYLELAESGSPTALYYIGWCFETGSGVGQDDWQAMDWYYKGTVAGSWTSALSYARLLNKHGHFDDCDAVLDDGVEAGLITAYYRKARYCYERNPGKKSAQEIRHLLDHAIAHDHPGAEVFLFELMVWGKFGFRNIVNGIKLGIACFDRYEVEMSGAQRADPETAEL